MSNLDLAGYIPQFKDIVLVHLQAMPEDEWNAHRCRGYAFEGDSRAVDRSYVVATDETRESLLDQAVTDDAGPTIDEVVNSRSYKKLAIQIGKIDDQPVYYVEGVGVYIWAKDPGIGRNLSFWATYPAYPCGW
jgi:hypothetical protein